MRNAPTWLPPKPGLQLLRNIRARGASEYSAEWVQGEAHPGQGGYIATFFENCIEDR